ncbi:hypothetical protein ACFY19_20905 [Streptosporangium saharense]|uniref:hypothetical protein n=1 Tax=Streptosporangium saharense TaxID=1706840 RepID=UPI00367EB127
MRRLLAHLRGHADPRDDWDISAEEWLANARTADAAESRIRAKTGALSRPPYLTLNGISR